MAKIDPIEPEVAAAGSSVTVTGANFEAGTVEIRWDAVDGRILARVPGPAFTDAVVSVPSDAAPGVYYIVALSRDRNDPQRIAGQAAQSVTVTAAAGGAPQPSTSGTPTAGTGQPAPSSAAPAPTSSAADSPATASESTGAPAAGTATGAAAAADAGTTPAPATFSPAPGAPVSGPAAASPPSAPATRGSTAAAGAAAPAAEAAARAADQSPPAGVSRRSATDDLSTGFATTWDKGLTGGDLPTSQPASARSYVGLLLALGGLAMIGVAGAEVFVRKRQRHRA